MLQRNVVGPTSRISRPWPREVRSWNLQSGSGGTQLSYVLRDFFAGGKRPREVLAEFEGPVHHPCVAGEAPRIRHPVAPSVAVGPVGVRFPDGINIGGGVRRKPVINC